MRFYTVGHSNRTMEAFLALLRPHRMKTLVDVRRRPYSRRHPHFNAGNLAVALDEAGIEYIHEEALGGMREARANTPNTGWKEEAFRGYADYLATPEFHEALLRLGQYAGLGPLALMCAEAAPLHCHRQLIADALLLRGHDVAHILEGGALQPHALPPFARVGQDGTITYPAPQTELDFPCQFPFPDG